MHRRILASNASKLKALGLVNLGVLLFFGAFEPFYMSHYNPTTKWLVILAYLLICSSIMGASFFMAPRAVQRFSSIKQVFRPELWLMWHVMAICGAVFLFKVTFGFYDFSFARIATGLGAMMVVGGLAYLLLLALGNLQAKQFSDVPEAIPSNTIAIQNYRQKVVLTIEAHQLLYVESVKNDVRVVYLENGSIREVKIRQTLKETRNQLQAHLLLVQCHRAFLVNMDHPFQLKREHGRKFLQFDHHLIPVSRSGYDTLKGMV